MTRTVELFSATDPVYVRNRRVWYWLEFDGMRSKRLTEYGSVLEHANALVAEHDACLIDRSDKGSGFLLSTMAQ